MIFTTNFAVSQKLKSLGVKHDSYFSWFRTGEHYVLTEKVPAGNPFLDESSYSVSFPYEILGSAFTLSELVPVLQQVGEKLGWADRCCSGCGVQNGQVSFPECVKSNRVSHDRDGMPWFYYYMEIAGILATDTEDAANAYLEGLL